MARLGFLLTSLSSPQSAAEGRPWEPHNRKEKTKRLPGNMTQRETFHGRYFFKSLLPQRFFNIFKTRKRRTERLSFEIIIERERAHTKVRRLYATDGIELHVMETIRFPVRRGYGNSGLVLKRVALCTMHPRWIFPQIHLWILH